MGWASGSELARKLIKVIKKEVPDVWARKRIYAEMIDAMEDHDWDTQDEALGIDKVFDDLLSQRQR